MHDVLEVVDEEGDEEEAEEEEAQEHAHEPDEAAILVAGRRDDLRFAEWADDLHRRRPEAESNDGGLRHDNGARLHGHRLGVARIAGLRAVDGESAVLLLAITYCGGCVAFDGRCWYEPGGGWLYPAGGYGDEYCCCCCCCWYGGAFGSVL